MGRAQRVGPQSREMFSRSKGKDRPFLPVPSKIGSVISDSSLKLSKSEFIHLKSGTATHLLVWVIPDFFIFFIYSYVFNIHNTISCVTFIHSNCVKIQFTLIKN